jgi:hypothetical protein
MKSINLLITHDPDPRPVQLLKKYLPISAALIAAVFLVAFIASLIYTNIHVNQYAALKHQIETVEKNIVDQKKTEQNYVLSVNRVDTITQLLSTAVDMSPVLNQITQLGNSNVIISSSTIDSKGAVTLTVVADSVSEMESFVQTLIDKEDRDRIFSRMQSQGVVRDRKGKYTFSITLSAKLANNL